MNGLLVRVGVDGTYGRWNAPVRRSTGEFAYVPIPEPLRHRRGLETSYDRHAAATSALGVALPAHLIGQPTHLDPDFDHLTFGDQGRRAAQIGRLRPGDFLAFYAGMRAVDEPGPGLVYALIGLYVIDECVPAGDVPRSRWHENAHTRRIPGATDIVVRARPGVSGRFERCLPFGAFRDRAYRVRPDVLQAWGGLGIGGGYVQRSITLPPFRDPARFMRWLAARRPSLVASNGDRPCAAAA